MYIAPLAALIQQFERMPGIGHKTAMRLAFHVLDKTEEDAKAFADAIINAKQSIHYCKVCQDLTDSDLCRICSSSKRDKNTICVVEGPKDVLAMEKTGEYDGLYHVLHGVISPMDGIGPEDIKAKELIGRIAQGDVTEIIMATNLTVEGEATSAYLAKLIKPLGVKVTRIARGMPVGGDLEYVDEITLTMALEGRREI
ncbi:MAG: recombination mediator RecR [Bacillota bacterium]|nr:recombination mediator RecR [Bacillota bacterium]